MDHFENEIVTSTPTPKDFHIDGRFSTLYGFDEVLKDCRTELWGGRAVELKAALNLSAQMIWDTHQLGKKIVLIGNGGSAAIASHQAVDLWKNGGIRAITFNEPSLLTCIGNDLGYENVFAKPIAMFGEVGDLLIAVSSSGKSANILNGVQAARELGMRAITFSGFEATNPLFTKGEINFFLPSFSYGIVEVGHLLLLHAVIDEVIASTRKK